MLYTTEELIKKLGSFSKVSTASKQKKYFKVGHGIYSDVEPALIELESIFVKYPNAVLTLKSAFSYYDMSDYIPETYQIATPHNAHVICNDKVEQIFMSSDLIAIGKKKVKTQFGFINIYDKERLLIELIRYRSKLSYSYFKEVINSYRELVKNDELNLAKLLDYCHKFKNGNTIQKHIQEIVM